MATCTSAGAERRLPVGRAALADVAELGGARPPSLGGTPARSVSSDSCGTPSACEPCVGERDRDPRVVRGIGRRPSGVDQRDAAVAPARGRRPDHRCAAAGRSRRRATVARAARRSGCRRAPGRHRRRAVRLASGSIVSGGARAAGAGPGSAASGTGTCGDAGRVEWSTPSRMVGPFPALISWVKIVSMTSSLSARPPHVRWASPRRAASSISRNEPCSA